MGFIPHLGALAALYLDSAFLEFLSWVHSAHPKYSGQRHFQAIGADKPKPLISCENQPSELDKARPQSVDAYFSGPRNTSRLIVHCFHQECLLGTQKWKAQELHLGELQVRDHLCFGRNLKHEQIWSCFNFSLNVFGAEPLKPKQKIWTESSLRLN